MRDQATLEEIAAFLRHDRGLQSKQDINKACGELGITAQSLGQVGDDCAVIPEEDGSYSLYAIEGFINEFVEKDPWFAGWCGVMVNLSDILAMGGRPKAVVNAIWTPNETAAYKVLQGMKAASETYGIPIVGGHSNFSTAQSQLAVSILGKTNVILSSFEAKPGEKLMTAVDMRGEYRAPFDNWQAALNAPPERLRADMALLPELAEKGLCKAAKDISQGGIVGTALMLAEASNVGLNIQLDAIKCPENVDLLRWIKSFPSFGFLLSVPPENVDAVQAHFAARDITCAVIGDVLDGSKVQISNATDTADVWDHATHPYLGLSRKEEDHA